MRLPSTTEPCSILHEGHRRGGALCLPIHGSHGLFRVTDDSDAYCGSCHLTSPRSVFSSFSGLELSVEARLFVVAAIFALNFRGRRFLGQGHATAPGTFKNVSGFLDLLPQGAVTCPSSQTAASCGAAGRFTPPCPRKRRAAETAPQHLTRHTISPAAETHQPHRSKTKARPTPYHVRQKGPARERPFMVRLGHETAVPRCPTGSLFVNHDAGYSHDCKPTRMPRNRGSAGAGAAARHGHRRPAWRHDASGLHRRPTLQRPSPRFITRGFPASFKRCHKSRKPQTSIHGRQISMRERRATGS